MISTSILALLAAAGLSSAQGPIDQETNDVYLPPIEVTAPKAPYRHRNFPGYVKNQIANVSKIQFIPTKLIETSEESGSIAVEAGKYTVTLKSGETSVYQEVEYEGRLACALLNGTGPAIVFDWEYGHIFKTDGGCERAKSPAYDMTLVNHTQSVGPMPSTIMMPAIKSIVTGNDQPEQVEDVPTFVKSILPRLTQISMGTADQPQWIAGTLFKTSEGWVLRTGPEELPYTVYDDGASTGLLCLQGQDGQWALVDIVEGNIKNADKGCSSTGSAPWSIQFVWYEKENAAPVGEL